MNKKYLSILIVIFFIGISVNAQEIDGIPVTEDESKTFTPDSLFIINSFNFNIKGFTRKDALIYKGEFKKDEIIEGIYNLEKYISDKTQLLMNERVLENVVINFNIGEVREDGMFPVDLLIDIKDTWNIVAIPRPRYSSNTGFDIILKARDYNFLGTMSPLRLDLGYIYDNEKRSSFTIGLDSLTPFRLFGFQWNFNFTHLFDYRPDTEEPFFYRNTTGLSVDLPYKFTTVTLGIDESFHLNEENSDTDKPIYGNFQEGLYMSSVPYISWKIPTNFYIGDFGELVYTPSVSLYINHEFKKWPLNDTRKGPVLFSSHNLGFKHIDWIVNFQKGVNAYIDSSFSYNYFKSSRGEQPYLAYLKVSGTGHFLITDFFGISGRLMYRHWFLYEQGYTEAADALRGILDKDVQADYMISLNLDFPFRVFRFTPSIWLNKPKLRVFNFDLHFSPVIDTALFNYSSDDNSFSSENILITGGFEVIIFPEFFRSLFLRVSLGWNLRNMLNSDNIEIYVGTDFHY